MVKLFTIPQKDLFGNKFIKVKYKNQSFLYFVRCAYWELNPGYMLIRHG